jgi:hypothetical protein
VVKGVSEHPETLLRSFGGLSEFHPSGPSLQLLALLAASWPSRAFAK